MNINNMENKFSKNEKKVFFDFESVKFFGFVYLVYNNIFKILTSTILFKNY